MELKNIKLDEKELQKKAQEFAFEAAVEELKDYYLGYHSPYRKAIKEDLESKSTDFKLDLPNIVALLNETLSQEVTKIYNTAIANTYIPMVNEIITGQEKNMNFSKLLEAYIDSPYDDFEDYQVEVNYRTEYDWVEIILSGGESSFEFTLHKVRKEDHKYHLLGMPRQTGKYNEKMVIEVDNKKIEMPFTNQGLNNRFLTFLCSLILADTHLTIDTEEFQREWFHNCHC